MQESDDSAAPGVGCIDPARADFAQGRVCQGPPLATIDIGSNSVRLVVYEGLTRSPTPVFNEKVMCGLGRLDPATRRLPAEGVTKALAALHRFRGLCDVMEVGDVYVLATAASRDAADGDEFIRQAAEICRTEIEIISGKREAQLSALGVVSGFHAPDGLVGDMGGGSLELIEVKGSRVGGGMTTPLGGLALQDAAGDNIAKAQKIARKIVEDAGPIGKLKGRSFYAVGGTWRALAKLHMSQTGYPLHVMHGYTVPARDMLEFCRLLMRVDPETLSRKASVSSARLPLLAYGAAVLEAVIRAGKPKDVVISALGVREGLLYSMLDAETRAEDPLLSSARELNVLRSRSPRHGEELLSWGDAFMRSTGIDESADERRLRHAACLLADIGWRAHPDYRGEQSLNIIANAAFVGLDHSGRAYVALANFFRHSGGSDDDLSPRLRELATTRILDRARIVGALMRLGYAVSASMPGVLPRTPLRVRRGALILVLPPEFAGLAGDRLSSRLKSLGKLIGREVAVQVQEAPETVPAMEEAVEA